SAALYTGPFLPFQLDHLPPISSVRCGRNATYVASRNFIYCDSSFCNADWDSAWNSLRDSSKETTTIITREAQFESEYRQLFTNIKTA
ncbi:hypothetical protein PENTCL1PPCAC_313, partial [Pristionchus entomophagus]